MPSADVGIGLHTLPQTVSECPYKGDGQYWHLSTGRGRVEDIGWSRQHSLPQGFAAAQHICFDPAKVDIDVDGEPVIP